MEERSDAALVTAARARDTAAFGALVTRYQDMVYRLAFGIVGEWAAAQDLVQDSFFRAYQRLETLQDPARFAGWLRRITFRLGMNHLRAAGRLSLDLEHLDDLPELLQRPSAEDQAEARAVGEALLEAIAGLPPRYRVPLSLHHIRGLPQERVAHFLGVPLGTVKSLVSRARRLLRAQLDDQIEGAIPMVEDLFDAHPLPDDFAETLTAAIGAAQEGDAARLEALLRDNPYLVRARHGQFERSLLHVASWRGQQPIVELLLRSGADASQRDKGDNAYAAGGRPSRRIFRRTRNLLTFR